MNRKSFIQAQGADCNNWTWSWSFINIEKKFIIFGAWDTNTEGYRSLIFSETWATNRSGRKNPAYNQSREHIRLVEEQGYALFTFPIRFSDELQDADGVGRAKIKSFEPVLTQKSLIQVGGNWYAYDKKVLFSLAEEVSTQESFLEGATKTVSINAYERNRKARAACIRRHGAICAVCNFNFEVVYGAIAKGFIHVHHIVPLATIGKQYRLNPVKDLVPVCPNCHAVIHLTKPAMSIEEAKRCLSRTKTSLCS